MVEVTILLAQQILVGKDVGEPMFVAAICGRQSTRRPTFGEAHVAQLTNKVRPWRPRFTASSPTWCSSEGDQRRHVGLILQHKGQCPVQSALLEGGKANTNIMHTKRSKTQAKQPLHIPLIDQGPTRTTPSRSPCP